MEEFTCAWCGATALRPVGKRGRPRKYCSVACRRRATHSPDIASRNCEMPDCDRPHRARGLCAGHYNSAHRVRAVKRVACGGCGEPVDKTELSRRRTPVCSYRCRYFVQHGKWPEEGRELVGPVARTIWYSEPCGPEPRATQEIRFAQGRCGECDEPFVHDMRVTGTVALYCSERCGRRAGKRRSRLKHGRFAITEKRRQRIYERDGWVCQLCFDPVDASLHHSDVWSASLDHIVPQSWALAPDHSDSNLRLAHRWCNSVRGDETYYKAADLAAA